MSGLESIAAAAAQLERSRQEELRPIAATANAVHSPLPKTVQLPRDATAVVTSDPSFGQMAKGIPLPPRESLSSRIVTDEEQGSAASPAKRKNAPSAADKQEQDFTSYLKLQFERESLPPPPHPPAPNEPLQVKEGDVIFGRGGTSNHHKGNIRYRALVKKYQKLYLQAKRREKPRIALHIVEIVRREGGNFLKKDLANDTWTDVGNTKAREKTSQCLREGAPDIREDGSSVGGAGSSGSGGASSTKQQTSERVAKRHKTNPLAVVGSCSSSSSLEVTSSLAGSGIGICPALTKNGPLLASTSTATDPMAHLSMVASLAQPASCGGSADKGEGGGGGSHHLHAPPRPSLHPAPTPASSSSSSVAAFLEKQAAMAAAVQLQHQQQKQQDLMKKCARSSPPPSLALAPQVSSTSEVAVAVAAAGTPVVRPASLQMLHQLASSAPPPPPTSTPALLPVADAIDTGNNGEQQQPEKK